MAMEDLLTTTAFAFANMDEDDYLLEDMPDKQADNTHDILEEEKLKEAPILPYMWRKGQSGNPLGRPKGKTMKEYAREMLECQTEEERQAFFHGLPKEIIWKMAEGNPDNKSTVSATVETKTTIPQEALDIINDAIKEKKLNGDL